MEEKYFEIRVDALFEKHFQDYEEYLTEHGYPIEKCFRIQKKIFDFVNDSLINGIINLKMIEDSKLQKLIIEDHIVYYSLDFDKHMLILHNAKSTKQNRKPGY